MAKAVRSASTGALQPQLHRAQAFKKLPGPHEPWFWKELRPREAKEPLASFKEDVEVLVSPMSATTATSASAGAYWGLGTGPQGDPAVDFVYLRRGISWISGAFKAHATVAAAVGGERGGVGQYQGEGWTT